MSTCTLPDIAPGSWPVLVAVLLLLASAAGSVLALRHGDRSLTVAAVLPAVLALAIGPVVWNVGDCTSDAPVAPSRASTVAPAAAPED